MFGLAIIYSYKPRIIERAVTCARVRPEAAGACETHADPFDVSTLLAVPGDTDDTAEVPLPTNTAPVLNVVAPVPPLPTGRVPVTVAEARLTLSVPPRVSEPVEVTVPVRVIPLTVPVPETEVTVPTNWSADVMLKFGYAPVIVVVPPPVSVTVWSGDVLVTVIAPEPFEIEMAVPAVSVPLASEPSEVLPISNWPSV
jgi:hypothetical protein